jgi:hypothetical protein
VVCEPAASLFERAPLGETSEGEYPDRLQEPVAGRVGGRVGGDEGGVDQQLQRLCGGRLVENGVGPDGVRQLGGERAGEQAEPIEQRGDVGRQQPVRTAESAPTLLETGLLRTVSRRPVENPVEDRPCRNPRGPLPNVRKGPLQLGGRSR